MTDAAQIAKALTPAQRKALRYLASLSNGCSAYASAMTFHNHAARSLASKGLAIVTSRGSFAVNDLGRAVAAELEG